MARTTSTTGTSGGTAGTFAALHAATPKHGALAAHGTGVPNANLPTALLALVRSIARMANVALSTLPFKVPTGTTAAYAARNAQGLVVGYTLRGSTNNAGTAHATKQRWQAVFVGPKGPQRGKGLAALPSVGAGFAAPWARKAL